MKHALTYLFPFLCLLCCMSCTKEELNEDFLSGNWVVESSNETVVGFWGYATFMSSDNVSFDNTDRVKITRPAHNGVDQLVFDFDYRIMTPKDKGSYLEITVSSYYAVDPFGRVPFYISGTSHNRLYLNKVYDDNISNELVVLKRVSK